MNLHGIAKGAINVVNPDLTATLLRSTGYTMVADGVRTPTYDTFTGPIQVQGIAEGDYVHINAMNQQSVLRAVWLLGHWAGAIRVASEGGDVLKFPMFPGDSVRTWKILVVKETWPDWCSVIVVLQA